MTFLICKSLLIKVPAMITKFSSKAWLYVGS